MYPVLYETGFANQASATKRDDGLILKNLYITAAARCAPPDNKPLPQELANCAAYLDRELDGLKNVNGTSHKRRGRAGIYSGSECGIVRIRTRGDSMSGPIKVEIFGQMYSIQGELDAKYVQRLAKYVDEKMQAIADATKTVDTQKVAVLTALAIADELHSMQRDRSDREELLSEQAERCLTLVERALKQTA